MKRKRKLPAVVISLLILCAALCCLFAVLGVYLPIVVQSRILPAIAGKAGIENFSCDVRRIGLFGADLGSLKIGDGSQTGIFINSLNIDYSPKGIFNKQITKISFSGVKLFCDYENGNFIIPGVFPVKGAIMNGNQVTAAESSHHFGGFRVHEITISDAWINAQIAGKPYHVPLELKALPKKSDMTRFVCDVKVYPFGQLTELKVDIDLSEKTARLDLASFFLAKPFPVQLADLKTELSFMPDMMKADGNFITTVYQFQENQLFNASVLSPIDVTGEYGFQLAADGKWRFNVAGTASSKEEPDMKALHLAIQDYIITTGYPTFRLTGNGKQSGGRATCSISIPELKASADTTTLRMPSIDVRGDISFGHAAKPDEPSAVVELRAANTRLTVDSTQIDLPLISIAGDLKNIPSNNARFMGTAILSNGAITDTASQVNIRGINGKLPLCWPCRDFGKYGTFSIRSMLWDNKDIGNINGRVRQKESSVWFEGSHQNRLIPDLVLNFSGKSGIFDSSGLVSKIHYELKSFYPKSPIDLAKIVPGAAGLSITGGFELSGDLTHDNFGVNSTLTSKIINATLTGIEQDVSVAGIQADLYFPDLLQFKSAANQNFSFKSARLGNINIENGLVNFQIESLDSIFIEKSRFNWCNGHVDTQALRVSRSMDDYDLVLYCDRLNLAMILEQFGAADADGNGTVSGRIPLRYKNGSLTFNDGFLFSTPGDGGTIRVRGTEKLTAGIPPDTPQFVQMELAGEALKNYDYKWAKVGLHTEGEDLMLRLKFNGKPVDPIPFAYNKELGGFVKIEVGGKGALHPEIFLNINFRLPLNKILQYRDMFNMIH